jgi:transcriptional regulator with XRE-family HTH domain
MARRLADQIDIRTRLAAARVRRGVTQAELAAAVGMTLPTHRRLERGRMDSPPVRYLTNCALALGVEVEDLIEDDWREWHVLDQRAPEPPEPSRFWRAVATRRRLVAVGRFFHVDRKQRLHAGDTLGLTDPQTLEPIPQPGLQEHLLALFPEGLTWHGLGYLFWQNTPVFPTPEMPATFDDMRSHGIDLVAEFIRRAAYPTRPSRYQTVFAWETEEMARRFAEPDALIWEVDGECIFKADMNWLGMRTALETSHTLHRYWSGEPKSDKPTWECFLRPPVTVIAGAGEKA